MKWLVISLVLAVAGPASAQVFRPHGKLGAKRPLATATSKAPTHAAAAALTPPPRHASSKRKSRAATSSRPDDLTPKKDEFKITDDDEAKDNVKITDD